MTCPKCNAPIDAEMQLCVKCGAAVGVSPETIRPKHVGLWTIGKVLLWVTLLFGVLVVLLPFLGGLPILKANMSAVASRGRDIYIAITSANEDREPVGLPQLWPRTCLVSTNQQDISGKAFMTSTGYFYELYDGANVGTEKHNPYVKVFDYSRLAGSGVLAKSGKGMLLAKNNMWIIAANITDQDDDRIPILLTRNVDIKEIERVVNHGLKKSEFEIEIAVGKGQYKKPFGAKGFVGIRKGGWTFNYQARYATLGTLFNGQELPPRDPSKPPIVYLMP